MGIYKLDLNFLLNLIVSLSTKTQIGIEYFFEKVLNFDFSTKTAIHSFLLNITYGSEHSKGALMQCKRIIFEPETP